MIKIDKKHNSKHKSRDEWIKLSIMYAQEAYAANGMIRMSCVGRLVGSNRLTDLFGTLSNLISASGLPADAAYGSCDCSYCGVRFIKKAPNSKYCCEEHKIKSSSRRGCGRSGVMLEKQTCANCGAHFESEDIYKFCSEKCKNQNACRKRNSKRRSRTMKVESIRFDLSELIDRDGLNCSWCGMETDPNAHIDDDNKLNIDHIIPLSRGGDDAIYNSQVMCRKCNNKKGNRITSRDMSKANKLKPSDVEIKLLKASKDKIKTNKSGTTGVFFSSTCEKWVSRIEVDGKRIHLIATHDKDEAIRIRLKAEELLASGVGIKRLKLELNSCLN